MNNTQLKTLADVVIEDIESKRLEGKSDKIHNLKFEQLHVDNIVSTTLSVDDKIVWESQMTDKYVRTLIHKKEYKSFLIEMFTKAINKTLTNNEN